MITNFNENDNIFNYLPNKLCLLQSFVVNARVKTSKLVLVHILLQGNGTIFYQKLNFGLDKIFFI